jgi:hypothetical protein
MTNSVSELYLVLSISIVNFLKTGVLCFYHTDLSRIEQLLKTHQSDQQCGTIFCDCYIQAMFTQFQEKELDASWTAHLIKKVYMSDEFGHFVLKMVGQLEDKMKIAFDKTYLDMSKYHIGRVCTGRTCSDNYTITQTDVIATIISMLIVQNLQNLEISYREACWYCPMPTQLESFILNKKINENKVYMLLIIMFMCEKFLNKNQNFEPCPKIQVLISNPILTYAQIVCLHL